MINGIFMTKSVGGMGNRYPSWAFYFLHIYYWFGVNPGNLMTNSNRRNTSIRILFNVWKSIWMLIINAHVAGNRVGTIGGIEKTKPSPQYYISLLRIYCVSYNYDMM